MKPMAWLPNRHGFMFFVHTTDGKRLPATVVFENGTHRVNCDGYEWKDFVGWIDR